MAAGTEPGLEERVAALEAAKSPGLRPFDLPPLTAEQEAQLKRDFDETMPAAFTHRILPSLPALTPDEIRALLRECVTVVKPGETLILRVPWTTTPSQVRELQDALTDTGEYMEVPFKVLVVPGDELTVAQAPEPDFMAEVRADTFRSSRGVEAVRLTHLPTGVTVEAATREEAAAKLGGALARHAQRHYDLQEQQRREDRHAEARQP